MKKETTDKLVLTLIHNDSVFEQYKVKAIRINDHIISSFHHWAHNKPVHNLFLINTTHGQSIYFMFISWGKNNRNNYYLVLFPEDKSRPIAELHKTVSVGSLGTNLIWQYKPTKHDGRNNERKEYYKKCFGTIDVFISLPETILEAENFIDDIFSLYNNKLKADNLSQDYSDRNTTFPEGRLYEVLHKKRERSSNLVKQAKQTMKLKHGKLICQVCSFDFEETYGEWGEDFIEAHHTVPVSKLDETSQSRIEDIALVCSNCHRMLHRRRPWLEMHQLKTILN